MTLSFNPLYICNFTIIYGTLIKEIKTHVKIMVSVNNTFSESVLLSTKCVITTNPELVLLSTNCVIMCTIRH